MTIAEICMSPRPDHEPRQRDVVVTNDVASNRSRRSQSGAKCGDRHRFTARPSAQIGVLQNLPWFGSRGLSWINSHATTRGTAERVFGESITGFYRWGAEEQFFFVWAKFL